MRNLLLSVAVLLSSFTFAQSTNVTITLKGEKDAEWMCGKTSVKNNHFIHQAIDCYNGHLFINEQTIVINVTEAGGYCVRMKCDKFDQVTMVYFQIHEGDNYEIFKRVKGSIIKIDSTLESDSRASL
jgi:hypothetical protein